MHLSSHARISHLGLMQGNEYTECLEYIFNDMLSDLESVMIGEGKIPGMPKAVKDKSSLVNAGCVVEELRMFGEKCKHLSSFTVKDTILTLNLTSLTYVPC